MKNYQEFITEVNKHREQKLMFQYKDVTNPKPPVKPLDILKQKKGLKAQIVSPGKSSQLKFPGTSTGINIRLTNTENEMKGVKSQAELIKRLGFKSLKDIDDRNP